MYQFTGDPDTVLRVADGTFIPTDPENADYREYLAWIENGGTPEPAPQPDAKVVAQGQIEARERATLLPRAVREFMLDVIEDKAITLGAAQGLTKQQSLALLAAKNVGYVGVKQLDGEIAVLRAIVKG